MAHEDYHVRMRHFHLFALVVSLPLLAGGASAFAQSDESPGSGFHTPPEVAPSAPVDMAPRGVDGMLTQLKRERDPSTAQALASRVFARWNESDSATVNLLMKWAGEAIEQKRNAAALDFLDQAIVLNPGFAGSWNRRATLHYSMGEYRKSMADINRVLAIEPRHFGALAGLAAILADTGRDEMAMRAWERYLEIYPADRDAQDFLTKIAEKLAGSRT